MNGFERKHPEVVIDEAVLAKLAVMAVYNIPGVCDVEGVVIVPAVRGGHVGIWVGVSVEPHSWLSDVSGSGEVAVRDLVARFCEIQLGVVKIEVLHRSDSWEHGHARALC